MLGDRVRATRYFAYSGEVAIAALVVAVIGLMILPLPTPLIDTLLGINITLSVVLLMVTMYVPDSISLSSFPSLLLFTTLLRLSLNIASTKSILLHAEAGHIIESFGELVVGGNLVVGLVVFLIITTVQFIVIAKGSERVAEVGARFTLDAMPGKQMSIDADLRGGNLTADEARRKRARLAMVGACMLKASICSAMVRTPSFCTSTTRLIMLGLPTRCMAGGKGLEDCISA